MISKNKLALCVTLDDYNVFAGPDWPSYHDFLHGDRGVSAEIQQEISEFIDRFTAQGTRFPIKTATACQSKWTWSTIYLNQLSTASCHRVNPVPFALEDFDNFHNIPKKIQDRKLMLEGKWPTGGCEYCRDIEHAGGWSDRQHNLEIRGLTPDEVEHDPTSVVVSPKIVEIFAQNTCNLACVYCNGYLSSRIENENKKFGAFKKDGVLIPVTTYPTSATQEYFDKFITWLDRNIQKLVRLHLLGGETFIQHQLMHAVLDVIKRRPNPNLQFCVFSNCNVPDRYWDEYTQQIKYLQQHRHIKVFDLTASIDCWGPEQEYVRSGLDLEKFEQRLEWAARQGNWIRVNANQTVTAMTMKTMPDLIYKLAYYSQYKSIGHYFQFYTGSHMFQHPKHFAWQFWQDDCQRILAAIPTTSEHNLETRQRMTGMIDFLRSHKHFNWAAIQQLHIYLDEIDRRRGTNWRSLFSYLDLQQQQHEQ